MKLSNYLLVFVGILAVSAHQATAAPTTGGKSDISMAYQEGNLTLDYVSSLTFGMNPITSKEQTVFARAQVMREGSDMPNYIQVTNLSGKMTGWTLNARQDAQFSAVESHKELTGATLTYANGTLASVSSDQAPSYYKKNFDLTVGASKTVVRATGDEGFGTWVYRFGNQNTKDKSISLTIPAATTKLAELYKTQVTWSLNDVPNNN